MSNELEVGTHIDLSYMNTPVVTKRPKKVSNFNLRAWALDNSGTRFSFKPRRQITVVFA